MRRLGANSNRRQIAQAPREGLHPRPLEMTSVSDCVSDFLAESENRKKSPLPKPFAGKGICVERTRRRLGPLGGTYLSRFIRRRKRGKTQGFLGFSAFFFALRSCRFPLSLYLEISRNGRVRAKEWAKGNLPSIGSRGGERLRFRAGAGRRDRQPLDGGGQVIETRMRVAGSQGVRRMPGQVLMLTRRNASFAYHRDERMPQGVEVGISAVPVPGGAQPAAATAAVQARWR